MYLQTIENIKSLIGAENAEALKEFNSERNLYAEAIRRIDAKEITLIEEILKQNDIYKGTNLMYMGELVQVISVNKSSTVYVRRLKTDGKTFYSLQSHSGYKLPLHDILTAEIVYTK